MMNLDLTLSPALETALEAHANVLRLTEETVALGAAFTKAYKVLAALPKRGWGREVMTAIENYDRIEAAYKAAQEAADEAEAALVAACASAGIETL